MRYFGNKDIIQILNRVFQLNIFDIFIMKYLNNGFSKDDRITPANGFVYDLIEYLKEKEFKISIPIVLDDNTSKAYNTKISSFEGIDSLNAKQIIIVSPQYNKILEEKTTMYSNAKIINTADFIIEENPIQSIQKKDFINYIQYMTQGTEIEIFENEIFLLVIKTEYSDQNVRIEKISHDLNAKVISFDIKCIDEVLKLSMFLINNCRKNKLYLYITAVHTNYSLCCVLKQIFKEHIHIILYIYDYLPFMIKYFGEKRIYQLSGLSAEIITCETQSAHDIFIHDIVDFLIYKDKGLDFINVKGNTKRVFWPVLYLMDPSQGTDVCKRDPKKIVYIGNLYSPEINNLVSSFKKLLDANYSIDVYFNGCLTPLLEYEKILNSEKFNIKKGLPIEKLIEKLKYEDYGFGLCNISDMTIKDNDDYYVSYAIPSKITTYIQLELPIIVSEQLIYCSELVMKHNIGIVIKASDEVDEVINKLNNANIELMINNMKKFKSHLMQQKDKITFNEG